METPCVPSKRRKTLINSVLESPICSMRQSIGPVTSTPVVFQTNDDEDERLSWKRLSTLQNEPEAQKSPQIPLNTLEEFLGNWVRMSVENKINAKNVWKIHIIDYLRILVDKKTENPLQLATASLAAGAKVYSLRVDDLYTDVIRLAGSLGHRGNKDTDNDVNEDGENGHPEGNDEGAEGNQRAKAKKKKKTKGKTTTNPESLVGDLDLLDSCHPIFAELNTRSGDIIGTDNMFQVFVPLNSQTIEYDIRTDEKYFDSKIIKRSDNSDSEMQVDEDKMVLPFTLQPPSAIPDYICPTFSKFSLTNWSPDEEDASNSQQNQSIGPSTMDKINLAFDINAEPQEIMDVTMEDLGDARDISSDEEAAEGANVIEGNLKTAVCKPAIETIVDMRPSHPNRTRNLEYSYNAIVSGIWAGPAHWKIKSIVHRPQPRITMQQSNVVEARNKRKTKTRVVNVEIAYEEEDPVAVKSFYKCSENKLKLTAFYGWDRNRNELPIDLHVNIAQTQKLFINKNWSLALEERPASALSIENNQYDYNNLNDSAFCNPPDPELLEKSNQDYSDHEIDHGDMMCTSGDHAEEGIMLTGDNLLPAPRIIPKQYVPYSTRAKKVNMKIIKLTMWNLITKDTGDEDIENINNLNTDCSNTKEASETKFSTVIEKLPGLLPRDQASNISVPLAYFGLLHLANEHTLKLEGNDQLTDVLINKG